MNRRPTTRAALSIAGVLAALLTLTSCGGDSAAEAMAESTAAAEPSGAPDITAYRDCMAENGVTLPDMGAPPTTMPTAMPSAMPRAMPSGAPGGLPGGLPEGVDQATFDDAQAACADLAPAFGPGGQGGPGVAGNVDASALAAFTSCLSDNGVTVAAGQDPMSSLDRSDPDVQAAVDTCTPLLPVPTPSASG